MNAHCVQSLSDLWRAHFVRRIIVRTFRVDTNASVWSHVARTVDLHQAYKFFGLTTQERLLSPRMTQLFHESDHDEKSRTSPRSVSGLTDRGPVEQRRHPGRAPNVDVTIETDGDKSVVTPLSGPLAFFSVIPCPQIMRFASLREFQKALAGHAHTLSREELEEFVRKFEILPKEVDGRSAIGYATFFSL